MQQTFTNKVFESFRGIILLLNCDDDIYTYPLVSQMSIMHLSVHILSSLSLSFHLKT